MTKSIKRFLLVDDDPLNNYLSKVVLEMSLGVVEIKDFVNPELALNYIENEFEYKPLEEKTILFLDINMPTLSGWEFLDKFNKLEEAIKNQFSIYMLSSSIDPFDIERVKLNPYLIDFIEKPLDKTIIAEMFS
jgi:CheY-like chemotaxis protein